MDILLVDVRKAQDANNNEAAASFLRDLVAKFPEDKVLRIELSTAERDIGNFDEAIRHGEIAVERWPKWDLASLALFFALLDSSKIGRATKEMLRFLALKDSDLYRDMMKEVLLRLSDASDENTFEAVLQRLHEYGRYEEILCEVRAQLAAEAEEEKSSEP